MFYSYYFNTGPLSKKRFEARFKTGAGKNPLTGEEEHWLGMSFNSMFDGRGMKLHGRPSLNVVIGMWSLLPKEQYCILGFDMLSPIKHL